MTPCRATIRRERINTMNRVLIMDDDSRVCTLLRRIAESQGFEAFAINNPALFADSFIGFAPDLIMLDLKMGAADGIEILQYLAHVKTGATIVLLSGVDHTIIESARRYGEAMALNITDICKKPFAGDEISEIFKRYFQTPLNAELEVTDISAEQLGQALENHNLFLQYQPIVSLQTGAVLAVEALVRWRDEIEHIVLPEHFIPLAEQTGLIGKLTWYVIETSIRECRSILWRNEEIALSVNIPGLLLNDLRFPDKLATLVDEFALPARRFILEVKNHRCLHEQNQVMNVCSRLRLKGFRICLDDFDRRSLTLISETKLPFTELKLNRKYIARLHEHSDAVTALRSALDFAVVHSLPVYVKGLDQQAKLDLLKTLNCAGAQGFQISYPLSDSGLDAWVDQHKLLRGKPAA